MTGPSDTPRVGEWVHVPVFGRCAMMRVWDVHHCFALFDRQEIDGASVKRFDDEDSWHPWCHVELVERLV